MGDRAVVCFANKKDIEKYLIGDGLKLNEDFYKENEKKVGIYLHWDGSDVETLIKECNKRGYRGGASDNYGIARFCAVACERHDDGLSVGVDTLDNLDCNNFDNGLFVVDDNWEIIGRLYSD